MLPLALEFQCHSCNEFILLMYVKRGEEYLCPYCDHRNIVPENAMDVDEADLNSEEKRKERHKRWIGQYSLPE